MVANARKKEDLRFDSDMRNVESTCRGRALEDSASNNIDEHTLGGSDKENNPAQKHRARYFKVRTDHH